MLDGDVQMTFAVNRRASDAQRDEGDLGKGFATQKLIFTCVSEVDT